MAAFLVDYENVFAHVGLKGVEYLNGRDRLTIFYSKACQNIRKDEDEARRVQLHNRITTYFWTDRWHGNLPTIKECCVDGGKNHKAIKSAEEAPTHYLRFIFNFTHKTAILMQEVLVWQFFSAVQPVRSRKR